MSKCLEGIDVAVLAGGMGTRISKVLGDTPKALAPINNKPYLDHLLDWFSTYNATHIVLCLGHLADKIINHVANRKNVETLVEPKPMGTGGALRFAMSHLTSDPVLVMNGDTWLGTNLCSFLESHMKSNALVSLLCVSVEDASRYGGIELKQGTITCFREKDSENPGPGIVSAGAYLISQAAFGILSASKGPSLERDFLQLLPAETIHGYLPQSINFIDIGTPESLAAAKAVLTGGPIR